eukprot:11106445-Alexandrium_andersonii.AAC.1
MPHAASQKRNGALASASQRPATARFRAPPRAMRLLLGLFLKKVGKLEGRHGALFKNHVHSGGRD